MDKIYLPGLNGIRAIAASVVLIFHIDEYLKLFGLPQIGFGSNGMAYFSVDMFFALSGYLITYLLLTEKDKFGHVELKKFYMRRILRIWPIYYVAILITFFFYLSGMLQPNANVPLTFLMFSFFLPNVAHAWGLDFVTMFPLWSVGVEEQFYAIWPVVVNKIKKLFPFLIVLVIVYLVVKLLLILANNIAVQALYHYASLDALGIGALMAYIIHKKHPLIKLVFHPAIQVAAWLFLGISLFYKPVHIFYYFDFPMHAGVYAILIANVSANPQTLITLENKVLNFLGKISYGIYIYNMIIIFLGGYFLKDYFTTFDNLLLKYFIAFGISIVGTILLSSFSYYYFEVWILKFKARFSKIHSTNQRKEGSLQPIPVLDGVSGQSAFAAEEVRNTSFR